MFGRWFFYGGLFAHAPMRGLRVRHLLFLFILIFFFSEILGFIEILDLLEFLSKIIYLILQDPIGEI
jgi:hypothetical protein